ncbi:unnamed protein product [Linum tenue]|uniref:C2H2-type domain-containing protein n=1 Tax=Linum tenue TaxID=586396 RepID=A0AAV0PZC0_9ROSI|nr:unnamed protein product [Linum tenue]
MFPSFRWLSHYSLQWAQLKNHNPFLDSCRFHHFNTKSTTLPPETPHNTPTVAIFWDLDNKPPNSIPPFEAAMKLKRAASSFGVVQHTVAYANRYAFSYVPQAVREQRKDRKLLNQLENKGVIKPVEPYVCKVCGRKFCNNEKMLNHFKQIHEREHQKRVNQIESARGKRRVNLVGKYAMKMQKYRNASREVLTPKTGYGLADELKRAGFWVGTVSNKPQAADVALKEHMVDVMDKKKAECVVLVSDDSDFVGVVKEAKSRCLKTVVVGNLEHGALKRIADAGFSWQEVLMGKAKKEAISVVEKWSDREILERLEWRFDPEKERDAYAAVDAFYNGTECSLNCAEAVNFAPADWIPHGGSEPSCIRCFCSVLVRKKSNVDSMAMDFQKLVSELSLAGFVVGLPLVIGQK